MLIQYAYIKPRSQFGKQCIFEETEPIVQTNILPDPELMKNYVHRNHSHRGTQKSQQLALHKMQTVSNGTKKSGMLHLEGGWPKEINVTDEEAVLRFRRRVEKSENWAPRMKKLTNMMERSILSNNVINIYENYFDDIVPAALVPSYNIRTSCMYTDPQPVTRPVNHLSWSTDEQNRLAASYSFAEFKTKPPGVNPCSYIWDIENPVTPVVCLRSSSPLIITEFNPRDPPMLISGLMSGQVCNWDIRVGDRPVQMSHRQFSHRNPANQALWIASKTNMEFFSSSTDGTIRWWDIRKLRQPTEVLVMNLDDPLRADISGAIGVTALQYEPSMSMRFLAGMQNGLVINVNRKIQNLAEKLAARLHCHHGPVIAIDQHPFAPQNFLTVGDWTVKIWANNTKEGCLIGIREQSVALNGACWSRSRYSVFFTINATGLLEVYDTLISVESPVTVCHVCDECLTAIAPHKNGRILAVGSYDGNIHLMECSEGHTDNTRTDKTNFFAYLERSSRFEKAVDARLREMHLTQVREEDSASDHSSLVSKREQKKRGDREKSRDKSVQAGHVKTQEELPRKRFRKKTKDEAFFQELAETEAAFFHTVERELASYADLEEVQLTRRETSRTRKKILRESVTKIEEKTRQPEESLPKRKTRRTTTMPARLAKERRAEDEEAVAKTEVIARTEVIATTEAPLTKRAKKRRRGKSKVCAVGVCKPEICCADLEEKRKAALLSPKRKKSALEKRESLTAVLADEVEEARREVRYAGKRNSRPPGTIGVAREKPEGKKKKAESGDDVSPVRDAKEGRSDFRRQLAETSSKWRSGNESEDKISRARGKGRAARQLEPNPEEGARRSETHPTSPSSAHDDGSGEKTTTKRRTSGDGN